MLKLFVDKIEPSLFFFFLSGQVILAALSFFVYFIVPFPLCIRIPASHSRKQVVAHPKPDSVDDS